MSQETELQAKDKLLWLGMKRASQSLSKIKNEIDHLRNSVGEYSTFQDHMENGFDLDDDGTKESIDTFSDFETYLQDSAHGWTATEAQTFTEKIKNNFTDEDNSGSVFDDFQEYVVNTAESYTELKNAFGSSTEIGGDRTSVDGYKVSGVKFHETDGVTKGGVNVPAGTTEIFGTEIHFSESSAPSSSDSDDASGFTVGSIQTDDDDNTLTVGETVTISADITNNNSETELYSASLKEDGSEIDSQTILIGSGNTQTVNFTVTKSSYVCHEYQISTTGLVEVCWIPSQLT